jgi:hypothetical protein
VPRPHPVRRGTSTTLRLARPRVRALDPLNSPTPRQKSEHLMRLPATICRHGCDQDRRGNNTGVSPHCFTTHPVMGSETRHYTHLTLHYLSSDTLEEGYDKARIPQSLGFDLIRPASTQPRPSLDASHSSTGKEGRHGMALWVISTTHPLRHGTQGWLATPGHVATVHSTGFDKKSPQDSPPSWPPLTL